MEVRKEGNNNENNNNTLNNVKSKNKNINFITIDYKFYDKNYFIANINNSIRDKTCPFCNKIFYSKFNRNRHQDKDHKNKKIEGYSIINENGGADDEQIKKTKIQNNNNSNENNNDKSEKKDKEIIKISINNINIFSSELYFLCSLSLLFIDIFIISLSFFSDLSLLFSFELLLF